MPEVAASQIYDKLPEGEIYEEDHLILHVKDTIGIEDIPLVQEAIEILVEQQKLIVVEKG